MPLRLSPGEETVSGVIKVVIRAKLVRPLKKEAELYLNTGARRTFLIDRVVMGCEETAELRINPNLFEVEYVSVTKEPFVVYIMQDEKGYMTLTNDPALLEYPEW